MLTPNGLFFAPGTRFKDLQIEDPGSFAGALAARADDWFFKPATTVATQSPFAAGIIVVCFIDAAAQLTNRDFVEWLAEAVPETANDDPRRTDRSIAESFKEDVRHGLVHHARLNRGAEFSLDLDKSIAVVDSVLIVNPQRLLDMVRGKWNECLDRMRVDPSVHRTIAAQVRRAFKADFDADATWLSGHCSQG